MDQEKRRDRWRRWLQQVEATEDDELSCSECFDLLSRYVDLELDGRPAAEAMPRLRQHLDQCGVCRDEHVVLLELASRAARDDLPSDEDLLDTFDPA
jgi:hypothetical protein